MDRGVARAQHLNSGGRRLSRAKAADRRRRRSASARRRWIRTRTHFVSRHHTSVCSTAGIDTDLPTPVYHLVARRCRRLAGTGAPLPIIGLASKSCTCTIRIYRIIAYQLNGAITRSHRTARRPNAGPRTRGTPRGPRRGAAEAVARTTKSFISRPVESKRIHRRVRWNGTIPQYRAISLLRLRASGRSRHARKRPVRSRHESRATTRRMAVAPRTRARVPAPPNDVIILMITLIMVNAHSVLVQQSRGSQSAVDSTP